MGSLISLLGRTKNKIRCLGLELISLGYSNWVGREIMFGPARGIKLLDQNVMEMVWARVLPFTPLLPFTISQSCHFLISFKFSIICPDKRGKFGLHPRTPSAKTPHQPFSFKLPIWFEFLECDFISDISNRPRYHIKHGYPQLLVKLLKRCS